jgi:SAM-dependent methyltransferase
VPETHRLDFPAGHFDVVVANAVIEHIPQPRQEHIREIWRVLRPGGTLFINETPNKYLPWDYHTTGGLWFVPWLPSGVARRYAIWRGRYKPGEDWAHSGWRGLGYYELTRAIPGRFRVEHERSRVRHRVFRKLRLPAGLIDPYPTYVIRKL